MTHSIIDGDGLLFQSAYKVSSVNKAFNKLIGKIEELVCQDFDQTGDFTFFMEGPGNWRKDIFPNYKGNRGKTDDPHRELRNQLYNHVASAGVAIQAVGCETDDLVRRKAENMRKRGQDYVIISSDKDLDCIPGQHIRFNPKWEVTMYHVTEAEAEYNYFKQLLIGDMQDYIRSPHLLGPKTAENILAKPRDQWRSLIEKEYKERCGSEWEHALYFTGSLIHIQRYKDDMFNWNKTGTWWDKGFVGHPSCYAY